MLHALSSGHHNFLKLWRELLLVLRAKCDEHGYYYSYNQTVPYQESDYDRARRSGQYDYAYYEDQRCRLAPAPTSGDQYRYVRVCPDSQGRYRITS